MLFLLLFSVDQNRRRRSRRRSRRIRTDSLPNRREESNTRETSHIQGTYIITTILL